MMGVQLIGDTTFLFFDLSHAASSLGIVNNMNCNPILAGLTRLSDVDKVLTKVVIMSLHQEDISPIIEHIHNPQYQCVIT